MEMKYKITEKVGQHLDIVPNEMQIFIRTINGEILTCEIHRSNTIRNIKMKIQEKIKLLADQQNLLFQGKILKDDKTINEYQLCDQSVIDIIDKYKIFILLKPIEGINNAIYVHKTFKIVDIKYKIHEKTELPHDEQKLIYKDKILEDGKTLEECKIDENSVMNIVVEMINGINIFAQTNDDRTVLIYVQKSDKIIDVKNKISWKIDLDADEQEFIFQGRILKDNKTIDEYQICNQSLINVVARSSPKLSFKRVFKSMVMKDMKNIEILVNVEDKSFSIIIQEHFLFIEYIKQQIYYKSGLHPDEQRLFRDGVPFGENLVDVLSLRMYSCSRIDVVKMTEVFAKILKGKIFSIYLLRTDSIGNVKKKIQEKTKLHPDEQILVYQYKLLDDDNKTVDYYGIRELSMIDILVRLKNEIQILVKTSNKSIIPINIVKNCKIADLKSKIKQETEMQFDNLIYKNSFLSEKKSLSEYQIDDGCVISIDDSLFSVFLQEIKSGSLDLVQDLYDNKFLEMENGPYSHNPMHYACKQRNADIVKFLIEKNFKIEVYDSEKKMPIHYACINNCFKILEILIQHKCNLEVCDSYGMKPIHLACLNDNFQNVKLLTENRCDLESKDYLGRRPIHLACLVGNIEIVNLLIQNKCNIDVHDKANRYPIYFAEQENHTDIMEVINEKISGRMIENMILKLGLKCDNNCDHSICPTSLRNKTFNEGVKFGQGGAGTFYRCKLSHSFHEIAIKKISKDKINSRNIEENINNFIEKINHERIIKYYAATTKDENIFIFMEFMNGGSLRSQNSTNPPMIPSKVIHYTIQVLEGLQFLHSNKIIHRDIKPNNILLDNDGNVKISDFGLGLLLCATDSHTTQANTFCGTSYYLAPEIINGETYSYGADIWSLGVTVIEMATGIRPYPELVQEAVIYKIATTKTIQYQLPPSSPTKLKVFIDQMLMPNPSKRPSAGDLIKSFKTI